MWRRRQIQAFCSSCVILMTRAVCLGDSLERLARCSPAKLDTMFINRSEQWDGGVHHPAQTAQKIWNGCWTLCCKLIDKLGHIACYVDSLTFTNMYGMCICDEVLDSTLRFVHHTIRLHSSSEKTLCQRSKIDSWRWCEGSCTTAYNYLYGLAGSIG